MNNRSLQLVVLVTSLVGLCDSIYLSWIKLTNNQALCIQGLGDCWTVNTSRFSQVFGIPIAIFGALAYLAILACIWFEKRHEKFSTASVYAVFGISLAGTLYSAYLTYVEIAVIKAICPFCVVSAIAMVVILVATVFRLKTTASDS